MGVNTRGGTRSGLDGPAVAALFRSQLLAVDPSGRWLHRWKLGMQACGVQHLRSPAIVHPGATDREALLGFVAQHNRHKELQEAAGLWKRAAGNELYTLARGQSRVCFVRPLIGSTCALESLTLRLGY